MGPNDPFGGGAPLRDARPAVPESVYRDAAEAAPGGAVRVGFGVGVATGLLALLTSFPDALAVLGLGVLGAAVAAGFQNLTPLRSNLQAALQALLGRE